MIEQHWLRRSSLSPMLQFLKGRDNERKNRLFVVAFAHLLWESFPDGLMKEAIDLSEQYADGLIGAGRLKEQYGKVYSLGIQSVVDPDCRVWYEENIPNLVLTLANAATFDHLPVDSLWVHLKSRPGVKQFRSQPARLLRDIYGNPFRPITFSRSWCTDTALSLARQMYDSRDFSAMPILADALQDAGCDCVEVLNHCRSGCVHVRGCWVVDLVLGKT